MATIPKLCSPNS